jgi:hypothetical protein
MAKLYTTREAAEKADMHQTFVQRLISSGKIVAPPLRKYEGGVSVRLWSVRDIARLCQYKAEHPRGRPRKRKKK